MGIGAALQQIGGGLMSWGMQRKDTQAQQKLQQDAAQKEAELYQQRMAALQRLQAPPEKVDQFYNEQLGKVENVRRQWQLNPEGTGGSWVETGRDIAAPAPSAPKFEKYRVGDEEVAALIDPATGEVKELGRGNAFAPSQRQVGGRGKGESDDGGVIGLDTKGAMQGYAWNKDRTEQFVIPGGPADFRQQQADAKQQAAESKASSFTSVDKRNIASLRQSLGNLDAIEAQLAKVEEAYAPLKGTISAGGFGQGMIPTESGKRFDAAVGQLAPLMRQLTRVPGEGAMSDYETKLMERANLNRGDYESTTAEKMTNLRQLVSEAKQARLSALDVYGLDANGEPKAKKEPNAAPQGQAGATRNNPVQISSEAEADALPPGTWVMLNGRLGQT